MPVQPRKKQKEIFSNLTKVFIAKGYKNLGYNGQNDDSWRFGAVADGICCYVQYISIRAWKRPKESLKVVVEQNQKNESDKDFDVGNDLWGQGSRLVYIIPDDNESYNRALRLISTINHIY
jgi:hypothetical protein